MKEAERDGVREVMRPSPPRREPDAMETLRTYMLGRIPGFRLPDANTWDAEAAKMRRSMLEEVIFKGVPDAWREGALRVEWKDVIETGKGYRIRKLTYHALPGSPSSTGRPGRPGQPGLVIPALLYEPDDLGDTTPGVLNLNGHVGPPGKAVDYKQERCINLAKRGMVALNPEWLGFGELQGPGYQHNNAAYLDLCGVAGIAVFYLAMSRALDVLLDQERVDPERIAVTGLSGGGWQTIILAALDTRVRLAAPNAGYIGLDSRVKHPADRGDIEQNAADLAATADYPLLTAMLAPRPALLLYNEYDDCCFQTARARPSVYEPVRPLYTSYGRQDAFEFHSNIDPGTHNYEREHRERLYRFLNRHFLAGERGRDEEIPSADEVRSEEELTVGTPMGNADFVTLARSVAIGLKRERPPGEPAALRRWQEAGRERLRSILRYRPFPVEDVVRMASEPGDGRQTTYSHYHLRDGWVLPVRNTVPSTRVYGKKRLILADAGSRGASVPVEEALREGNAAMVVEVAMQGACELGKAPHQWTMMLSSNGERMLGLQVAQLAAVMDHEAAALSGLTALGPASSVIALMASSLSSHAVEEIKLRQGLASLHRLIDEPGRYETLSPLFCFGLLASFDIEDLVALVHPVRVDLSTDADA
ncbi:MAG: acetylxylan esterase [Gemmatimonadetes bacterium]|nr:acetylxylan esterase [Gemmatimonadota bacterium]